jgi:hypothetical protein
VTDSPTANAPPDPAPRVVAVHPAPEPAVLTAILAAVEEAWPKPSPPAASADAQRSSAWRFSGRWWSKSATLRRDRPGAGR